MIQNEFYGFSFEFFLTSCIVIVIITIGGDVL